MNFVGIYLYYSKFPFTEHVLRMGVRRRKQAFHIYTDIYDRCKTLEFLHVHVLADIFIQAPLQPGDLDRAEGHR